MAVNQRAAYTLVELVLSMAAASVLMGGLAASLFLTLEACEGQPAAAAATQAAGVQAEMLRDLGRATGFTTRTASTVTFTVPDEDDDGVEETLTYAYDSAAGTLSLTRQGFTASLLTGVTDSTFGYLSRDRTGAAPTPTPYDTGDWGMRWYVGFEGFAEVSGKNVSSIAVPVPVGVESGELLISVVVTNSDEVATPPAGGGWIEIDQEVHSSSEITLAVWWKIAEAFEPLDYTFSTSASHQFYGWIMRFSRYDRDNPFNAVSSVQDGSASSTPASPAVVSTVERTMILRIGAFDDDDITTGDPGLSGHRIVTMGASGSGSKSCSGGAGFVYQDEAADSGSADFNLNASEESLTITIAIAPE
ncbi:hypothetical protein Pla123a_29230 [Posidoniimonas polymericola]|uniref:Uncharacterized protein n=1 Tax=Posidoniimonas polymericola TaxID=2528002 RepID=A0A5C5YMI3_9BACT|nr:hypothetical protein [Posidoniimonas polymericola]TWT76134.1 hypothetical protein Pla123a_29230 [Posidoniimonas polymericola]